MNTDNMKRNLEDLPYSFNTTDEAKSAVLSLQREYDDRVSAYNIGRTLFVQKHKSLLMRLNVHDFIRSIGGREATTL